MNVERFSEIGKSVKNTATIAGRRIVHVLKYVQRELFFFVPFIVLFFVGMDFTLKFSFSEGDQSPDQYRILFVAIGLTATLSGISLRCSTACKDDRKKNLFYGAGERLFHATLLFAVATPCVYCLNSEAPFVGYEPVAVFLKIVLSFSAWMFFAHGIVYVCLSFAVLHRVLFPGFGDDAPVKAIHREFDEIDKIRPL